MLEQLLKQQKALVLKTQTQFELQDSFTYALCDDDTPTNTCVSATVTISVIDAITFNIPTELVDYYSGVIFSEDADLMFEELDRHTSNKHTTILTYIQRHDYLYDADADLSSSNKVVLMYSGERRFWREYTSGTNSYSPQTFNTEHVYPQSLLNSTNSITDLHHLRTCDDATNTQRSNNPFGEGSGTYELSNNQWYPGNGNYVKIRHNATYSTQYLHMSRRLVSVGEYVKQGDVIGKVGMTGNTGGPHVCYRFWKNGKQVDPFRQKLPDAKALPANLKSDFKVFMAPLKQQLDSIN